MESHFYSQFDNEEQLSRIKTITDRVVAELSTYSTYHTTDESIRAGIRTQIVALVRVVLSLTSRKEEPVSDEEVFEAVAGLLFDVFNLKRSSK